MKTRIQQIVMVFLFIAPIMLFGQTTTKNIAMPKGKNATTVSGVCKGYQTIENVIQLADDKSLSVKMKANINGCYFNVIAPSGEFIFSGEQEEQRECIVRTSGAGKYKIQVYNIRSVARRGTPASYSLDIKIM